jgi:GR25 family glycosyltransferase involved in LPS biosynthesis
MKIPKIFCISLKKNIERKNIISNQNQKLNITFFDGVDGKKFGFKSIESKKNDFDDNKIIIPGRIGCFLSHYMLWNHLLYLDDEEFIIIEDDAIFKNNFEEKFINYKHQLPSDWQYVFLGYSCFDNANNPIKINTNIAVCDLPPLGTFGYMIKKSILSILIETNSEIWSALDIQIQQISLKKIKHHIFYPALINHNYEIPSIIHEN